MVYGLKFRVWGLGFWAHNVHRIHGVPRLSGLGFRVHRVNRVRRVYSVHWD